MDTEARAIIAACLKHRLAGAAALDALDHAMRGCQVGADDFGRDAIPPASFALVVAWALDGARAREWERMHLADPVERAAMLTRWAREVWPQFLSRYGLD